MDPIEIVVDDDAEFSLTDYMSAKAESKPEEQAPEPNDEPEPETKPEPKADEHTDDLDDELAPKIPRARLNKEIAAKTQYKTAAEQHAARVAELEAELAKYQKPAEPTPPPAPKEIKPEDYDSLEEYTEAVRKAAREEMETLVDTKIQNTKQREVEVQYENAVAQEFNSKVEAAKAEIPDIEAAVQHIGKLSNHIPAAVRKAMLTADNAPEIIYAVATSAEALQALVHGDPLEVIQSLSRMDGAISAKKGSRTTPVTQEEAPKAKPKLPANPSGKPSVSSPVDIDSLSTAQYMKLRKEGKI